MSPMQTMARLSIAAVARALVARQLSVQVDGLERVPREGPVLLVARHYHHLWDACVLLTVVPRPLHFLVALDWARDEWQRAGMEWACATARWPVVLRAESLEARAETPRARASETAGRASAYAPREVPRYLRRGLADARRLLAEGRALVVFPEGYPTVDPAGTPKAEGCAFLPFRAGFAHLAAPATARPRVPVPIVPVGFSYDRPPGRRVAVTFGAPLYADEWSDRAHLVRATEARVHALSERRLVGA